MTTGTEIIKRALQKIGASSALSEPQEESIITAFEVLNAMLSSWTSQNIMTAATLLETPADELNEKQDTQNAIILNLAVMLGPDFDNGKSVVSQDLRTQAYVEFMRIKSLYQEIDIPKKVISSTVARGQGNWRNRNGRVFFSKGAVIGN